MEIGKALKDERKKAGLNQKTAAEKIGISQSYLSQVETNTKKASPDLLEQICKAYDTSIHMVTWYSMTENDVPKNKRLLYRSFKPIFDEWLESVLGK